MQKQNKPKSRKIRRTSETYMMMNDDDFQDTGFSNRDVAVRADVL